MIEARFSGRLGEFRLDAAFTAPASGITGLFGPSGCGKTSVLHCLAGLVRLGGSLRVGDEVWQAGRVFIKPHRRGAAYVFQDADLFAHLNVRRNLDYGRRRSGARPGVDFDEVVGLLGLEPLLGRSPARLSGGERQRVAIGRALLSRPRLLLLDEPLAGLDAAAKAEILPYLEKLHASLAIPAIYVSHDLSEVARLADHLVVMKAGKVIASGACGSGPLSGAATDEARALLRAQEPDVTIGLALAALMAGLSPVGASEVRPSTRPLTRPTQDDVEG
ncbi:MAG TPA: molybdenum ABC transporter ATP-binding protein [Caulobacteraceae bacterium]|nr:molybdenum ABC transporter ATP-binding protein [Caulobacteraceae bacterium]